MQGLANGFVAFLPRLGLALIILVIFYLGGGFVRRLVRRWALREGQYRHLEIAVGRLAHAGIVLLGALVAAVAAFPTVTPGDLVGALGLGSVAIGFAFKDIVQNFLAGILILITRPFIVGDQIVFGDYEGDVEERSRIADVLVAQDKVLAEAKRRLQAAGVDLPYPTRQVLFHDQTEATDGDRSRQRGGWPAGGQPAPASRSIAAAIADRAVARDA